MLAQANTQNTLLTYLVEGKDVSGNTKQIRVSFEDAPPIPVTVRLPVPTALQGGLPSDVWRFVKMSVSPEAGKWLAGVRKKYGLVEVFQMSEKMSPQIFAQFLAKVAHAYAAAALGVQNFQPWLIPAILGKYKFTSHLVGGFEPEQQQASEPLRLRFPSDGSQQLVVAEISIRSFPDFPRYQVVCGALVASRSGPET